MQVPARRSLSTYDVSMAFVPLASAFLCLPALAASFRMQEIGTGLDVVYAVAIADVNGDNKPDVVAINNTQLMWFESPAWTKHVIAEKITGHDNVAVAPFDIDRDGRMDFALGADWQPSNTAGGGSLHW